MYHVADQVNRIRRLYRQKIAMLLALARDKGIPSALTNDITARKGMANAFIHIMRVSKDDDQIRLLDLTGREVVRVDRRGGRPHVVAASQLQDKARKEYVRRTLALPVGGIYVSPFDLNMEHGRVEKPHKAVIRFATPIVDGGGKKSGILVVNSLGLGFMQPELSEMELEGEHLLIHAGSFYWFEYHGTQLHVWRSGEHAVTMHRFSDVWKDIASGKNGQLMVAGGLFT